MFFLKLKYMYFKARMVIRYWHELQDCHTSEELDRRIDLIIERDKQKKESLTS